MRKVVNPKAAGALCSIMATKMISSTSTLERPAAAPRARPSAERERERGREREGEGERRERERGRERDIITYMTI